MIVLCICYLGLVGIKLIGYWWPHGITRHARNVRSAYLQSFVSVLYQVCFPLLTLQLPSA